MPKKILKQNWDTMKGWKEDVLSKLKFTAEPGKIYNTEKEGEAAKIGFRVEMQGKNTGVEEYRIQAQRNGDKKEVLQGYLVISHAKVPRFVML